MKRMMMNALKTLLVSACALAALTAQAQEATIRKNLTERIPQLQKSFQLKIQGLPFVTVCGRPACRRSRHWSPRH
jgi:phosphoglycerate-specific signal transduction histidine kinase